MEFEEFDIGIPFFTATGTWVCTDKGTRTIVAIKVDEHDVSWLSGPPYLVAETVFDENDMPGCWLDDAQLLNVRLRQVNEDPETLIPADVVLEGMKLRCSAESGSYPYQRLLRLPRGQGGRLLHPVAAQRHGDGWVIIVRTHDHRLLPIADGEFMALPIVPREAAQRIDKGPVDNV
jgi:hypothetical protein